MPDATNLSSTDVVVFSPTIANLPVALNQTQFVWLILTSLKRIVLTQLSLAGFNFTQSWDSLVYHLTGRGAGSFDGDEKRHEQWKKDMNNSTKEFIRKWGSNVNHTPMMDPIVPHKYNIGFLVHNCNLDILSILEPWCSNISVDNKDIIKLYFELEQSNTKVDLNKKITTKELNNDIIVEFNALNLNQQSFNMLMQFPYILSESGEVGEFGLDIFKITIQAMTTYEHELVHIYNK